MKTLSVSFLWHMHQPNYRDPAKGFYSMPWVRLHSVKAYYDMAVLGGKYPEMNLTINLVPSLLEQIEAYVSGAEDYELILSRKNPSSLSEEEKEAILLSFFQANHETMIRPFPRYSELLNNRGVSGTRSDIQNAKKTFSAQDYLDLQVLFNLSWFGFSAREEDAEIRKLIRKWRFYTVEERDLVLEKQLEVMKKLIPLYKDLWEKGSIDLSTTAFNHPILPLLCDTSSALHGIPNCLLPVHRYRYPEDAVKQVSMGMDYFKSRFGKKPDGMWPSEGSVSPEVMCILNDAGVKWIATDEDILAKSVKNYSRDRDLYHPWITENVSVFFRDRHLSDQIGFVYARNQASLAVDDFIAKLKAIAASGDGSPKCAAIVLDGENPWETYENSGKDFLVELYSRMAKEKELKTVSFTKFLEDNPPGETIKSIFPGSWINGNFDTWIGDKEEVDGWDALYNARAALVENESRLSPEEREEAWLEIFRAEGSDWFWWYGEDHSSANDPEFDRLFRAHLERVYRILGLEIPKEVAETLLVKIMTSADVEPTGLLSPVIDGRVTNFYEWLSSGYVQAIEPQGVMSGNINLFKAIYYGFDLKSVFFRFDFTVFEEPVDLTDYSVSILIQSDETHRADFTLDNPKDYILYRLVKDKWVRRTRKDTIAINKIIEIGILFQDMNMNSGRKASFNVFIYNKCLEKDRIPKNGSIPFTVPDSSFKSYMWQL